MSDRIIAALEELLAALKAEREPEKKEFWIGPFEWAGGPESPVPPETEVNAVEGDGFAYESIAAEFIPWERITSFSYLADNEAGWIPRPAGWVPPDEAWPFETMSQLEHELRKDGDPLWRKWDCITHIRLLSREVKPTVPELPEWASVDDEGWLIVWDVNGDTYALSHRRSPDNLDRIAEACRIHAARLRAGE